MFRLTIAGRAGNRFTSAREELLLLGTTMPSTAGAPTFRPAMQVLGAVSALEVLQLRFTTLKLLRVGDSTRAAADADAGFESPVLQLSLSAAQLAPSEASLHFDPQQHRWIVVSWQGTESSMRVCRSPKSSSSSSSRDTALKSATWRCVLLSPPPATAAAVAAQQYRDPRVARYAAKAHPDLLSLSHSSYTPAATTATGGSSGGEYLLVSHVSNNLGSFDEMFEAKSFSLYVPKFHLFQLFNGSKSDNWSTA